jgi:hypothetical protein
MRPGDYFQYPKEGPFKEPESYKKLKEISRNDRFWVKIMRPNLPFKFSENKMLHSNPICWTNKPESLSDNMGIEDDEIEKIAKEQKELLYKSLGNSYPAKPEFLETYDIELATTALFLRNKEKTPIYKD